ncbi:TonB-dependent receptor plug domain-containing protein, partial [bacterium]|nr:TonB-dependent receptor plug domain-containing protein [bacterium]
LGMTEVKGNLDVRSDGYFSMTLKKQLHAIDEVLVHGQKTQKRSSKLGMENVSVKTMKELPTLMGEKDVMKVAQMLPGIVSVGEGSAGVNVRGGNADQNLFYLNEIPVYNSSHLFGFFSSINSDIINNFTIYKGQIPAEYGGRLSSVFNVELRKGHKNSFFTQGGISPVSANAEIEIPVVKEKASLILSGRSSYSDWILKRLKDPNLRNSKASFYDFAAAFDYNLNDKNQINVLAYNSNDNFNLNGYTEYAYGNKGASVNYVHRFTPGLKSSVSVIGSNYNFETIEKSSASKAYSHSYELSHYEFRGSLSWLANEHHTFKAGTDLILYDLNRGVISPYGEESLRPTVNLGTEKGLETSVFIDDNISLGPRLNFYAGLRFSMFTELGPK